MSSFRTEHAVLRLSGSYTNGVWVPSVYTISSCLASMQPVKRADDMRSLPEGRRWVDYMKVYSDSKLQTDEDGAPDIIVHNSNGCGYEIIDCDTNQSNVINHYKYLAVLRLSAAEVNGILS